MFIITRRYANPAREETVVTWNRGSPFWPRWDDRD
jgi:hypothetical protein